MFKVIITLFFFSFCIQAKSSPRDKIVSQMKLTNNLSSNFVQKINVKNKKNSSFLNNTHINRTC